MNMNKFLQNNTVLKILALVMACIVWVIVHAPASSPTGAASVMETFHRPIHVAIGPSMTLAAIHPSEVSVSVTVSAANAVLLSSQMQNVDATVSAVGLAAGTHELRVSLQGMPSVQAYSVSPKVVQVVLAGKASASETVQVQTSGHPASGGLLGTVTVNPAVVSVTGPDPQVKQVAAVIADVSVDHATHTITETVPVVAVDGDGHPVQGVAVSPSRVMVTVPIVSQHDHVTLVPQLSGNPAAGYAVAGVSLNPGHVQLFGMPTAISVDDWTLPVSLEGLSSSTTLHLAVPLSRGVERANPAKVAVQVNIEPAATRSFVNLPIQVINVPSGESVTLLRVQKEDVHVYGPVSLVDNLQANDIQVTLNAANLPAGDDEATVAVHVPQWLVVTGVSATSVPVKVT
ncbi:MAG: CdaR family protein [Alicyclobacillaceae bacterium]|nr:CdaR family protein [Alicyclobacillaceae bacterium]